MLLFNSFPVAMFEALEVLVLIVGDRGTEHQNAQTRKIFSCFI
ncbi:hypothetical protein NC653_035341 [Populus alba x Populus x berolinensis]|uniref:Uncharacterized protein n=1 Tax=Populus alba x Populus x berolinensis TaxID=444605 RepID=A0AAD6LPR0_9ROSI|nr:hypothetical protein NC653_035341 [Populus alba x Populus x berolinensis]